MDVSALLFCSVCPCDATWMPWLYCSVVCPGYTTWMCCLYCYVVCVQVILRGYVGCIVLKCVSKLYYVDVLAVLLCSVCPSYTTWICWLYCSVVCGQVILRGWVGCIVL